jgi:hypothetical protein
LQNDSINQLDLAASNDFRRDHLDLPISKRRFLNDTKMNRTFTFIAIAVSTATCVSSTRLYVQAKIEPTDTIRVAYVRLDGKPLTLGHMEDF